ncbi:MAG: hypothetical protein M3N33_06615, partial [Actinomycetota bacterium]|nr:hypothetical protein [Actinomycetota bacterium]
MVGGLRPLEALEHEQLGEALSENGMPIKRLFSVRVTTSPRPKGRASRGLSHDLAPAAVMGSALAPG